jgi:hypothetical protein
MEDGSPWKKGWRSSVRVSLDKTLFVLFVFLLWIVQFRPRSDAKSTKKDSLLKVAFFSF